MAISALTGYAAEHYARRCIDTVTGLVPVSSCAFYRVDAQLRPRDYLLHRLAGRVHQVYLSHYQHLDPLHPARFGSGRHGVVPMAEALPKRLRQGSTYGAFMSRHGMADVVELFVRSRGRVVAGFSLIRTEELGPFSAGEVQTLEHLHGLLELAAESSLPPLESAGVVVAGPRLTPREHEIALLVRDGACNKTIARMLDLGLPTVKTHLQHLFRKFDVSNRTELVRQLFLAEDGPIDDKLAN
ncbi:MAG: helix-turn-helix transcriptional regulator [Pseudogulbenkiania sp.]|nr:helix-turn-helix transcriptional regulator [Pseudogulbenkiania sp.]